MLLNLEYASYGVTFHIIHPPLTRTRSAAPLPVPKEFMADPKKVGYGIARHISSKRFIICHSFWQKLQTLGCYCFPVKMGKLKAICLSRFIRLGFILCFLLNKLTVIRILVFLIYLNLLKKYIFSSMI